MARKAVVYLSRTGVMEPLGQSQILPYLRGIARERDVTLISREKAADLAETEGYERMMRECRDLGIDWRPRRFPLRSTALRTLGDIVVLAADALGALWRHRGQSPVLHARSYLPAFSAMLAGKIAGVPFLFDMRALWPEELVTSGRVRRGALVHRVLVWLEGVLLGHAGATVTLTEVSQQHLRAHWPAQMARGRLAVIPTCVDLDKFTPRPKAQAARVGRVHGVVGSVLTGWFRTDMLRRWFLAIAAADAAARFEIITRDPAGKVRAAVDPDGVLGARLTVGARDPADMPETLWGHDLTVFFYAGGNVSELGRSPTRMAEVLAAGLPVVANAGVGDVEAVVRRHDVGVLLADDSDAALAAAIAQLDALLADPDLPRRCRAAAEAGFSLASGTAAYLALYDALSGGRQKAGQRPE